MTPLGTRMVINDLNSTFKVEKPQILNSEPLYIASIWHFRILLGSGEF